ncbi:hypothetical protein [uncultured Alistipes sp.]|uniref:hypothetical protein n=1 Tax=uncultured Alistipes sp. TaxID=538949 RepID=UPI0025F310AD|nr:hypothetical protein [uncultured Alistipes sp.]
MKNAWYLKSVNTGMAFSTCLRKAWRNEKMAVMTAKIENRKPVEAKSYNMPTGEAFATGCLNYYANARIGQYLGD